jgi:hypothetical protein
LRSDFCQIAVLFSDRSYRRVGFLLHFMLSRFFCTKFVCYCVLLCVAFGS